MSEVKRQFRGPGTSTEGGVYQQPVGFSLSVGCPLSLPLPQHSSRPKKQIQLFPLISEGLGKWNIFQALTELVSGKTRISVPITRARTRALSTLPDGWSYSTFEPAGRRFWGPGSRRSGKLLCGQLAINEESGFGNSATFTFSEVSLCKVSVFIFSDEELEDSGFLFSK